MSDVLNAWTSHYLSPPKYLDTATRYSGLNGLPVTRPEPIPPILPVEDRVRRNPFSVFGPIYPK